MHLTWMIANHKVEVVATVAPPWSLTRYVVQESPSCIMRGRYAENLERHAVVSEESVKLQLLTALTETYAWLCLMFSGSRLPETPEEPPPIFSLSTWLGWSDSNFGRDACSASTVMDLRLLTVVQGRSSTDPVPEFPCGCLMLYLAEGATTGSSVSWLYQLTTSQKTELLD